MNTAASVDAALQLQLQRLKKEKWQYTMEKTALFERRHAGQD
jgi:hypothetical protein